MKKISGLWRLTGLWSSQDFVDSLWLVNLLAGEVEMNTPSRNPRARRPNEFIKPQAREYPVQTMCRVLDVAPRGHYEWLHKPVSEPPRTSRWLQQIRASRKSPCRTRRRSHASDSHGRPCTTALRARTGKPRRNGSNRFRPNARCVHVLIAASRAALSRKGRTGAEPRGSVAAPSASQGAAVMHDLIQLSP